MFLGSANHCSLSILFTDTYTTIDSQINALPSNLIEVTIGIFSRNLRRQYFHALFNMGTILKAKIFSYYVTSVLRWNPCRDQSGLSYSALRYKEILKNSPHFKYIIPTWSELELMFLNPEIGLWHKNFVVFGGVPRYVFPRACEINTHVMLDDALDQEGEIIATEFFKFSFGNVDSQQSYMLVHSNPALSVDEDYEYSGRTVYSFASDFIFQKLVKRHEVQMLAGAKGIFNCEAASASYGAVSGNLFEKVCLWLKPLNGRRIVAASLSGAAAITFDVPAESHLLQHDWKTTAELPVNKLILPRIANLEAGDSFFVVNESDSSFSLIIFQITVGESHPVKVNGLCDIWNAFPSNVKHNITRKVLVFIISLHGSLDREQKFITKRGKITTVPHIARDFEQYVCRYQI